MLNYDFLHLFTQEFLALDKSIRWIGVANSAGILIIDEYRENLITLLSPEENDEYASNAVRRHQSRLKFEPKIGKLIYVMGKYEKVNRVTIPINNQFYLLMAIDIERPETEDLIMNKVIPFIARNRDGFINKEE